MDFRIFDLDAGGLLFGSEREQIGFVRTGAVQTPGAIGECLDKLHFDDALGFEIIQEALAEAAIGDEGRAFSRLIARGQWGIDGGTHPDPSMEHEGCEAGCHFLDVIEREEQRS